MLDCVSTTISQPEAEHRGQSSTVYSSLFWALLIFCYLAFNSFDQIGVEKERLLGPEWLQTWRSTCAKTLLLLIQEVAVHWVQLYSLKGPHRDAAA